MLGRIAIVLFSAFSVGCDGRNAMNRQPKLKPMSPASFFADGSSSRPSIAGTVPRTGPIRLSEHDTQSTTSRPTLTLDLLQRGQERFNIFCSACHGRDGYGNGMVEKRGYPPAPSFHTEVLRSATDDHLFMVITQGYQSSPALGAVIPPEDRWAIVGYIRALQLSQSASPGDVPGNQTKILLSAK